MVRSPKSIAGAVGTTLGNAPYKSSDRTAINLHGAFPKIDRWSSRSHFRERTLQEQRSHCNQSAWCVPQNRSLEQ
ncbi:MAG: hypothetical protein ACKPKF_00935, partial [Microcystis panniformis]